MKILNPLQINDWEIRKFLCIVLAVQLAILGLIGFDSINLKIPLLRNLFGIVYLIFIPGLLLLRILKLHKLGNLETLLYSVGLSLSTVMFTGFLMDSLYPLFGVDKPISTKYLILTMSFIVLVFCIVSYMVDSNFCNPDFIDVSEILNPKLLFLCTIPFLAIFGAYVRNIYNTNLVILFLVIILAVIEICAVFSDWTSQRLYPLIIFISSFSLLFRNSLISNYMYGWDIQFEYYLANLVISNSWWDYSNSLSHVNSMLSVVMLAPFISCVSGLDLLWSLKIVYPFIYSLMPLGLYQVFKKEVGNNKIAFISVLFFVSFFVFHTEMLQLARQQIAEFFLVLILLLIFGDNLNKMKKSILLIIFTCSLTVSHYGLCYIFIGLIVLTAFSLYLGSILNISITMSEWRFSKNWIVLLAIFTLAWYIYTSGSSSFISLIQIGKHIYNNIFDQLLNYQSSQGLYLLTMKPTSFWQSMSKYFHLTAQFFISIGILNIFVRYIPFKLDKEYIGLCLASFILLLLCIAVPFFASSLNVSRIYHISLIFLSPFSLIGGIVVLKALLSLFNISFTPESKEKSIRFLSIFFVCFMLFNTEFVYSVANHNFYTSISKDTDAPLFTDKEIFCAKWIHNAKNTNLIYADNYRSLLLKSTDLKSVSDLSNNTINPNDAYLYLGTLNVLTNEILVYFVDGSLGYINVEKFCNYKNKIYSNGGAQIFY